MTAKSVQFGPYRLTPAERRLERAGAPVALGGRALDLLIALVERPGEVVSRRELMDRVWPEVTVEEGNLRVHVAGLRKALADGDGDGHYIANVSGRGYCFVAPVEPLPAQEPPGPAGPRASLPPRLSRMVGRDQTVAELAALVLQRRFVSIVGPGGMGKTTVAVAVANELVEPFAGQVTFVDLATLADPRLVIASVSTAIGAALTEPDPLAGLLAFATHRRMLIVLDNCEHLADAVAALTEQLYLRALDLHLLVTSREALRVDGEQLHLLEPLEGPVDLDAEAAELLKFSSVQLFMERAAAGGYREPLNDASAPLVARICHRLDGIALAIELVASRVGAYGLPRTADLLNNRFQLLWKGRRSALPRHQTLHAMLDWSFNLLPEADRALFTRLGVFAGPFDISAVQAVAGGEGYDALEVERSLDHLVEKSLVWTFASQTTSLYRLPHVARDFALGELAKRHEKREVAMKHARFVLSWLKASRPREQIDGADLEPPQPPPLVPCLRAALNWGFSEEGDHELAIALAAAAAPVWLQLGMLGECRHWTQHALGLLPDRRVDAAKELALQEALAYAVMFTRGNSGLAAAALERGLALAEALGEPSLQLRLLTLQHLFNFRSGAFGPCLEIALRSLDIAERLKAPRAQIAADWMLAISYHMLGRQKEGQRHAERGFALAASHTLGPNFLGYELVLARCHWVQGRWRRGVAFGGEAVREAERRGNPVGTCIALVNTTIVLLWNGSLDEAETVIVQLEKQADNHALTPYQACGVALRGELFGARGEHEAAIARLREALVRLHEENHRVISSGARRALADSLMRTGHLQQALMVIEDAIARAERSGGIFDLSELLRTQGEIRLRSGDMDGAESALVSAVGVADEQGAISWRLRSGESLARLWLSRGRAEAARAESSTLLALLGECDPGEPADATRRRLLELQAEASSGPG